MTKQESFKLRVRERMEKTGERYTAARRVLLEQAQNRARTWVSHPETGDESIAAATGRGWDEWCDLIDSSPADKDGHAAIAAWLQDEHGLDGWWAQQVTVGYERITGLRLPFQRSDGTFAISKSATIAVDIAELRSLLLSGEGREHLFPGYTTELRSRPESKGIRIAIGDGVALIGIESRGEVRAKVTVSHEKLPQYDLVERWKHYWSTWLSALDDS